MNLDSHMDHKLVSVIKGLVMDATRKANSGHPGGAMSSADFAAVLFREFLVFDPDDPSWHNRDRFVLSAGHESMLLYSLLYLCGFIELADIESFRQLGSRTPGHPEHDLTPGVEATTGPLGQGLAMAVGMAAAEAFQRAKFGAATVDHFTYVLASDGDLQEGVALGAASLAGLWGLGRLVVYYDSNKIQLAGPTSRADCTDYAKMFEAFCWRVISVDGHDRAALRRALAEARQDPDSPTLIIGHTTMAKGAATREGDSETHGSPLPAEEIAATKQKLGLPEGVEFFSPGDVREYFQERFGRLRETAAAWRAGVQARLAGGDEEFAGTWPLFMARRRDLPLAWPEFKPGEKIATRKAWGACLNHLHPRLPQLMGGSADLDPSNQTSAFRKAVGDFGAGRRLGRNLAFGVREFPMAAILNGLALHGGVVPFGATFLTFSDYCRNGLRMSALQKLPVLYVFTHDSFYLGEDGPTHQPVEHMSSLRLIPGLLDFRPCDANETAACLDTALRQEARPSCLFLTRQGLPVLDPGEYPGVLQGPRRGGYVLKDSRGEPELIIIATGSEVSLALDACRILKDKNVRLVSMPSVRLFDEQPREYRDQVLPPGVRARVAVEAGSPDLWSRYVGLDGLVLGIDHFGESAPAGQLAEKYGFTARNLARLIREHFN